jgi:hypothetical protein
VAACQAFAADKIIALSHKTRFSQVASAALAAFATLVDQQHLSANTGRLSGPHHSQSPRASKL